MANMNKNNTNRGGLEANPSPWDEISGIETTEQQQKRQDKIIDRQRFIKSTYDDYGYGDLIYSNDEKTELLMRAMNNDSEVKSAQEALRAVSTYNPNKQTIVDKLPEIEAGLTGEQYNLPLKERQHLTEMGGGDFNKGSAMRVIELRNRLEVTNNEKKRFKSAQIGKGALASIKNVFGGLMMSKKDRDHRDTVERILSDTERELGQLYVDISHHELDGTTYIHPGGNEEQDNKKREVLCAASRAYSEIAGGTQTDKWESALASWRNEKEEWGAES